MPPLALRLSALFLWVACAEDAPPGPPPARTAPPVPAAPTLVPDATYHDFGPVDGTEPLVWAFQLENPGPVPVRVLEVRPSCECMTSELTPPVLEPGERRALEVEWVPGGGGPRVQYVNLRLEGVSEPLRLALRARVTPPLAVEPPRADFGALPRGKARSMRLEVRASDPDAAVLEARSERPDVVRATFVPSGRTGPEAPVGHLELHLQPRTVRGPIGVDVFLECTRPSDPTRRFRIRVPVLAQVYGAVLFEPRGFLFGRVPPDGTIDSVVRVRRPDGAAFQVERLRLIHSPLEDLTVEAVPGEDDDGFYVELRLRGNAGDHTGAIRAKVQFQTDVPGDALQLLDVAGFVPPAGVRTGNR